MSNIKEERFKKNWSRFLSEHELNPNLPLYKFLRSNHVDISGFNKWMNDNGLTVPNSKHRVSKNNKKTIQTKEEVGNQTPIDKVYVSDINDQNASDTDKKQYWWLNIDSGTWDINGANEGDEKSISIIPRKSETNKDFDGELQKWLYSYFIDTKDNPHFGQPIAPQEMAISLLDFGGNSIDNGSIEKSKNLIRKNLKDYLNNMGIIMDPDAVLDQPSYKRRGGRQTRAWLTVLDPQGKPVKKTEKNKYRHYVSTGVRVPRELKPHTFVHYFYRNLPGCVPTKPPTKDKNNEEEYVQEASKTDPEIGYNTKDIQRFSLAKAGDLVFACCTSKKQIIAILEIVSNSKKQIGFKIIDKLTIPCPLSVLEKPYKNYCPGKLLGFFRLTNYIGTEIIKVMKYQEYIELLKENKNLILTGAPGTGKTHIAQNVAKIMGAETKFVQFHPSYDYSDFVEGLRPIEKGKDQIGFERRDGVFKQFCRQAVEAKFPDKDVETQDKPFVFIIDEINRGEVSKIFGELFYAIDPGYRGRKENLVQTQYQNLVPETDVFYEGFNVPDNVYIIGTMNDIDRSVENMDFAMRRRFTFIEVTPSDSEYILDSLDCAEEAKATMKRLNDAIEKTEGLGGAYMIGPAYFLKLASNGGDFSKLWKMSIEPLLKEYLRGFRRSSEILKKFNETYFDKKNSTKKRQSTDED